MRNVADGSAQGSLEMRLTKFLAIAVLGLGASAANAVPITYTVTGNGLLYGNPVGSFTYDAATNTYSNISLWSLDHYNRATSSSSANRLRAIGVMNSVLSMVFSAPLTDAGGNFTFSGYERGVLTFWGTVARSGEVRGANVPEPAAALLLGLGLVALWLGPRRKRLLAGH
jgi:hypothetical protein